MEKTSKNDQIPHKSAKKPREVSKKEHEAMKGEKIAELSLVMFHHKNQPYGNLKISGQGGDQELHMVLEAYFRSAPENHQKVLDEIIEERYNHKFNHALSTANDLIENNRKLAERAEFNVKRSEFYRQAGKMLVHFTIALLLLQVLLLAVMFSNPALIVKLKYLFNF